MKLKQRGIDYDQQEAKASIQVGMTLYGPCQGLFGNSTGDKLITEVHDTFLVVNENGTTLTSSPIDDWASLVNASNTALAREEIQKETT